jgi:hypothetical protein
MSYASRVGRARVSVGNPQAQAVCMRCGIWYNRTTLRFQYEWRGAQLQNLYVLVCPDCYDEPQQQLRAISLPADGIPIYFPSVENYDADEIDYRSVATAPVIDPISGLPIPSENLRVTQDCQNRITLPYGAPTGLDANGIMPLALNNGVPTAYNVLLPVLSVFGSSDTLYVTCSAPHNLQPNAQIAVTGLAGSGNGFFSVSIQTATVFTYPTTQAVNAQLTSTTRMVTAQVGLPRESVTFPMTYGQGSPITHPITAPGPPTDVVAS